MSTSIFLLVAGIAIYLVITNANKANRRNTLKQMIQADSELRSLEYYVSVTGENAIAMDGHGKRIFIIELQRGVLEVPASDIIECSLVEDGHVGSEVSGKVSFGLTSTRVKTTILEGGKVKTLSLRLKTRNPVLPVTQIYFLNNMTYLDKQNRLNIFYDPYRNALKEAEYWQSVISVITTA